MAFLDDGDFDDKVSKLLNKIPCDGYYLKFFISKRKQKVISNIELKEKSEVIPLMYLGKELGDLYLLGGKIDMSQLITLTLFLYSHYMTNEYKNLSEALSDKSKNMVVANVSHELRTPLNSIIGMINILQDTSLSMDQQGYIDIIKESAFNLLTLINELLDLSKLEAGCMQLKYAPMNISEAVSIVANIAKSEKNQDVSYREHIGSDVPNVVLADEQHFKQILINLLSNAFKYTKTGKVELSVSTCTKEEALNFGLTDDISIDCDDLVEPSNVGASVYIKVAITDTGIGIKEQDYDKLFKIFSQVDTSTKKVHKGTGLGLVLVQKLVTLMNGHIDFISEYKKGSTFFCIIPFKIYNYKESPNLDLSILNGINVLIVDDNVANIMSLCASLDKYDIDHRECTSSQAALLTYLSNSRYRFDLGLFDICMPNMDGNELLERMPTNRAFPVIALSSIGARVGSINPKFTAHLTKPFKEEELLRLMVKIIKHNRLKQSSIPVGSPSKSEPKRRQPQIDKFRQNTYVCGSSSPRVNFSMHILVVEDDENNRIVIKKMLNSLGFYKVKLVRSGKRAIRVIFDEMTPTETGKYTEKSIYDIILMDIVMPKMDGVETTRRIFKKFADKSLAPIVIAVTANVMESDIKSYVEHGFSGYVAKPILDKTTIFDAINESLTR